MVRTSTFHSNDNEVMITSTLVTRLYVSNFIKQILTFYDNFVFCNFSKKGKMDFINFHFVFSISVLFPAFPPRFPAFPTRFPAFPPSFPAFPPRFPAFLPLFPTFPPQFPAFPSFRSSIPYSGFYR